MNKFEGKNLEEALEKAADFENIDIEYLNYNILKQEESKTEIEVYFVSEVVSFVKEYISKILENSNLEFDVEGKQEKDVIDIKINSNHDAVLIGRGGSTLSAINTLVRAAINKKYGNHHKIIIDVGNYKQKEYEKIIKEARNTAKEVKKTKEKRTLNPMSADERRIVHETLKDYKNIKTESFTSSRGRSVVISYFEEEEKTEE